MDYKEKYNGALERARKIHSETEFDYEKGMMEEIFPELIEDKSEKIRKELIDYVNRLTASPNNIDKYNTWIAWLEKQGELNNNDTDILNRFSFYSYKDEPNILYLSELYVNKEQRNKGIGAKILKIADEVAANMKCNSIRLKTEIGSNAERLYRKNGYNSLKMEGNQIWLEKQGERELENYDEAEKEKADFVGDGFIVCHADFLDFKEGKTYWLEYIGDDKYNVRSDNLLGKTYHITPCQLYTVFKKLTELEKQGKTLDPDEVIEWLKTKVYGYSTYGVKMIEQFKKDFGL